MIELFISTATNRLIFSIIENGILIYNYNQVEKDSMSEKIMCIIENGFNETNIDKKNIKNIYVANGPGSFTGIRVGVTFAKVCAWSINAKLIPISTLELFASTEVPTKYVLSLIDARRGFVFGGMYDKYLDSIIPDKHVLLDSLLNNEDYTIVSDDKFDNCVKPDVDIMKIINKHRNDKGVDPHLLKPNYLKLTEAEEKMLSNDKRD